MLMIGYIGSARKRHIIPDFDAMTGADMNTKFYETTFADYYPWIKVLPGEWIAV